MIFFGFQSMARCTGAHRQVAREFVEDDVVEGEGGMRRLPLRCSFEEELRPRASQMVYVTWVFSSCWLDVFDE